MGHQVTSWYGPFRVGFNPDGTADVYRNADFIGCVEQPVAWQILKTLANADNERINGVSRIADIKSGRRWSHVSGETNG